MTSKVLVSRVLRGRIKYPAPLFSEKVMQTKEDIQENLTPPEFAEMDQMDILEPQDGFLLENGAIVNIFPVGFKHLKRFSAVFSGMMMTLGSMKVPKGMSEEDVTGVMIKQMLPHVLGNAFDMFEKCCVVIPPKEQPEFTLEDIPHWEIAPIIYSWIHKSFGEKKKWSPWVAVIESLIFKFTGKKMTLSEIAKKAMPV